MASEPMDWSSDEFGESAATTQQINSHPMIIKGAWTDVRVQIVEQNRKLITITNYVEVLGPNNSTVLLQTKQEIWWC